MRYSIKRFVICASIGALLGFLCSSVKAAEGDEFNLNYADLTYKKYIQNGRDALIYPAIHTSDLEMALGVTVFDFAYVHSSVFGLSDETQFRAVGLNYHIGIPLWRYTDIEYEHLSEHIIDGTSSILPGYPMYDSVNLVIHLVPKKF